MDTIRRRRIILGAMAGAFLLMVPTSVFGDLIADFVKKNANEDPGNFKNIFLNSETKAEFLLFLTNVYNIYPEREFHELISQLTAQHATDREIYSAILEKLHTVKPFLSEFTYAIPALSKQKEEISRQTMSLLGGKSQVSGYLEIGTPGRYISELKNHLDISGEIALVNVTEPGFSPLDILERGQLARIGRYVPLNDYAPILPESAAKYDVITNYIGFHHSRLEKLDGFVSSVSRLLKPGGVLILRDHDVDSERMNHMVSLAHDVFNAGLKQPWRSNHDEVRNFRSLQEWVVYLEARGLKYSRDLIYQNGDPTKNALMKFTKS